MPSRRGYNPLEVEREVSEFWERERIFEKVVELRKGGKVFAFLEGPPTANGFMHVGHARGRTMKDVVLRFKTMQGYDVWRRAGWDCHGLPVELEVEKLLGVKTKPDIVEKIGVERFIEECKKLVDYYIDHWVKASKRLGLWLDYDTAYETRRDDYIEFVWWALKRAYERGLYHRCVRRAQECVELCLKAVLRLYGVEYPKAHEVSAALVRIRDRLPPWFAGRLDLVVEASVSLASQRAPSFYGDELRRIPAGIYAEQDFPGTDPFRLRPGPGLFSAAGGSPGFHGKEAGGRVVGLTLARVPPCGLRGACSS